MRHWAIGVATFGLWCMHAAVHAQTAGFAIGRFDVAERGSDWFVADSLDLRGDVRPALGVVFEYAHRPLVLYSRSGDERAAIVRDQLYGHVGGSLIAVDRLRLGLTVPIAIVTEGDSARVLRQAIAAKQGASFGDLRFSGDLRLFGEYGDPVTLALGAQLFLASGSRESFTGDGKPRFAPHLSVAGRFGIFEYAARVSFQYRVQHEPIAGVHSGSELGLAAAAGVTAFDRLLLVGPELFGSTVIVDDAAFKRATTPLELLFGVHARPGDFRLGIAAGPGLSRGVGAPAVRVVGMLEWAPTIQHDRDGDGILDNLDACPDRAGDSREQGCALPQDRDLDGILDVDDACPDHPGVSSSDAARNGCPPRKDRDADGVFDTLDACPDSAGVATNAGCPPDRDGDAISDTLEGRQRNRRLEFHIIERAGQRVERQ
jgi:hypothetical protein